MKPILFLICTLFYSIVGQTQSSKWLFDQQGLEDGLSNTYVAEIIKDSRGYVWIATYNGLNKYNSYNYKVYKHDDKDPTSINSDVVECVFEDSKKRLWVGTRIGLNELDYSTGEFTHYDIDSTLNPNKKGFLVNVILEGPNGMLWIGTSSQGLLKFDPDKGTFEKVTPKNGVDKLFYSTYIRTIIIDQNEDLWIGTNGHGIIRYDIANNEIKWYSSHISEEYAIDMSYTFALFEDEEGDIWAGTYVGGLAKYEPTLDNFRTIQNPYNPEESLKNGIVAIHQKNKGELLLGANGGGLFFFNKETEEFTENYRYDPSDANSISDDFVGVIYIDETDIIWFGTENGGLSIYDPNIRKFDLFTKTGKTDNDLPGNVINCIYESEDGLIWFGTENNGFASLDRSTNTYKSYKIKNAQTERGNTFVKQIISDGEDGLWIGTYMGGLARVNLNGEIIERYSPQIAAEEPHEMVENDLNAVLRDPKGNVWLGGFSSLEKKVGNTFTNYCRYEPEEGQFCREAIECIYQIDQNNIAVGLGTRGFYFVDIRTNKLSRDFTTANSDLSHNKVYTFCKDSKNRLWIGTEKGLNQFNLADSSMTTIYQSDGLPDNRIFGILEDNSGQLWISTSYGLCCFNPDEMTFQNYYISDGLQSNVFRQGSYFKSKSGELFFGGVGGFNAFYPDQIGSMPNTSPIVFTDFQVFNKSVKRGEIPTVEVQIGEAEIVKLNYDESIFSFEFAALNYTLSGENEYAYMLEGFHEDWQYIGQRRYITFTNISPGEYTLRVKSCNSDGVWNEDGASIDIIIYPPFWETWWFRLLSILFALLLIYFIYKWRIRSIERQNKILEKQVKVRTEQVVQQKNEIEDQKDLVEQKNKDITASIRYSKRIQESFLPNITELEPYFASAFVLFKPKDIVSGDFYWLETSKNKEDVLISVADCTGHGVPGAMVSVLGNNGLNRSVNELHLQQPHKILDNLNGFVQNAFDKKDSNVQDGMDIALCAINVKSKMLQFAGANNPVWIARNNKIHVIKGTKQPIGNYHKTAAFELNNYQLESGDWVFLFSDGYADQFGGMKGKKYKYTQLKNKLLQFIAEPNGSFEDFLEAEFNNWKGEHEQVDDVCLLGFKMG